MNERREDFELLQRYTRDGEQSAFADLVRRHVDLVFATALRKVADAGGAQEIAQNVFSVLARKGGRFAPDDSLPAWLYKAALLESKSWLRGEMRRRRREAAAAELGTTMKTSEDEFAFHTLVPLLDDALLSLREKDRTALLLRFYESHSLRDVGAAFGVSEDTAQKRVESALRKLAKFFKRRGFKTATLGAIVAALQHTAAPASAAVVGAVVSAALKAAPPALVGLGALLARLSSLNRVQTAAVCVALAVVPLAWQLSKRHAAADEMKRIQTQLLAAQNEGANVQREIEGLQAISGTLEQALVERNEAAARALEAAQAFETWKDRTRRQLMAADYQWDDESLFARIPKSALPELFGRTTEAAFRSPQGMVAPYVQELLGLTSAERQALETALQRHFAENVWLLATNSVQTNLALSGRMVAATAFVSSAQDQTGKLVDATMVEIRGIVGEERWPLLTRLGDSWPEYHTLHLRKILNLPPQPNLEVWVETDDTGALTTRTRASNNVTWSGKLSMFLPEGNPNRTPVNDGSLSGMWIDVRERVVAWLQEQAIARLGSKKENP